MLCIRHRIRHIIVWNPPPHLAAQVEIFPCRLIVNMFELWTYEPSTLAHESWRQKWVLWWFPFPAVCVWQKELALNHTLFITHPVSLFPCTFSPSLLPLLSVCVRARTCGFMCVATRINPVIQLMLIGMTFNTHTQGSRDWTHCERVTEKRDTGIVI